MIVTIDTNAGEDAVFAAAARAVASVPHTPPPPPEESVVLRRERLDVGDILVKLHDDRGDMGCGEGDKSIDKSSEASASASSSPSSSPSSSASSPAVCIERKTWADLCASVCDGRLHEQQSRMVNPAVRYVYVVEDEEVRPWEGHHRGMRQKCLWGALVKMQLRDGFSVVHTRSPADTAELALYLAKQLRDGGFEPKAARGDVVTGVQKRKRDNLSDPAAVLKAMLTVIPGMSVAKAEVVVRRFGTTADLVHADAKELAGLACGARALGPKMAAAIKAVFFAAP